jgi:hypothetical protein
VYKDLEERKDLLELKETQDPVELKESQAHRE